MNYETDNMHKNFYRMGEFMGKFIHFFCFLFLSVTLLAADEPKKTICLNMIVKNESHVIERCLEPLKPFIDYWIIVDTGSEDDTKKIIKEYMKEIPGELHEQPWVNFEHNRNEALKLAKDKADYVLFIDADDTLSFDSQFKWPHLDKDFYHILIKHSGTNYYRTQLINNHLDWKWVGVLHEYIGSSQAKTYAPLEGVSIIFNGDGARSQDPRKFQKDAEILEVALKKEPANERYAFYLAQSYKDADEPAKALEAYKRRITMGGWNEEVFYSMLQIAHLQQRLSIPPETFIASYYQAYHYRPKRVEPLYYLSNYYRCKGDYALGYIIASVGQEISKPNDILFVEKWIYDYGLLLELSICAYWIGKYEECKELSQALLAKSDLPANVRDCIEKNLVFALTKLAELNPDSLVSKKKIKDQQLMYSLFSQL